MRVPLTWLRSYCDPACRAEEIAERLDLTGTEVERIERVGVRLRRRLRGGQGAAAPRSTPTPTG